GGRRAPWYGVAPPRRANRRRHNGLARERSAVARGCVQQGWIAARERVLRMQDRCPFQPDARQIAREDVVALWTHATLDPGHEVVERLLARLAIETAVAGRANHALYEQLTGSGRNRATSVRLLHAERDPRVARLVH